MTLFKKEYRETAPMVLASSSFLILAGWLMAISQQQAPYLVQGLAIVRFIAGISVCSVLGSVVFAGDRERGTDEFLYALPLTPGRIFMTKTLAGLSGTSVILLATCFPDPAGNTARWWTLMFLGYAIGQFCGIDFGHSVNASALSTAISLAIFCGVIGSPYLNRHYILTTIAILSVTAGIIWCAAWFNRHRQK